MNLLDSTTLDLGETATYCRREIQWFPFDANGFGGLIIRQWFRSYRRGTARLNQESDFYQVVELDPPPGGTARCFALHNVCDREQEYPYKVLIGRNVSCSCKAGRCHAPSDKHVESLQLLIETGVLDGLDDDPAPECHVERPGEPTAFELAGVS